MKFRLLIFFGIILIFVVIGTRLLKQPANPPKNPPSMATNSLAASPSKTSIVTSPAPIFTNKLDTNSLTNAQSISEAYHQGLISKDEAIIKTMLEKNKESQDFYGKVIDQYRQPIVGVKVTGNLIFNTETFGGIKAENYVTQTDAEGLFQFTGLHGADFNVLVKKDGYKMGEHREGYQAPIGGKSSPSNRAILTMRKLRGPEPLNYSAIEARIPHDGTPAVFDIATGRQSPNGNFRVTLYQYPLEVDKGWEKFDWSVTIEIPNGGLVEENDVYPYWAPIDGYQPSYEFNESTNSVQWLGGLQKKFYIKTAQGQYGLMQLKVFPGRSPTGFQAYFTINPSGSQNLESKE